MKVRLLIDCWGSNPEYDRKKPKDRKTNWPEVKRPKGMEIEHPDAWLLCIPKDDDKFPTQAEPIDDEAKAKVEEVLERMGRAKKQRQQRNEAEAAASKPGRRRRSKPSNSSESM